MNGTPQDIDAQLAQMRTELTNTVNELTGRLNPKNLGAEAKDQALEKAEKAKASIVEMFHDAVSGDVKSIGVLSGGALGFLLVVLRLLKRR